MIYKSRPSGFIESTEVASVFCECDNKILLLLRQDSKPQGNTWGVPAGKIATGETARRAILRELKEETGINISPERFMYFKKVYVRYPEFDFVYYIFHTKLGERSKVVVNEREHKGFIWVNPVEALTMNLIQDLDECIKLFYDLKGTFIK